MADKVLDPSRIPKDVMDAAKRLSDWMKSNGYERWQIEGCADRGSIERLQRQLNAAELLADSDREFMQNIRARLSVVLKDLSERR